MKLALFFTKSTPILFLLLALLTSGGLTWVTLRLLPYGCTIEKTLLEQERKNMNEDGYTYDVQIQGLYNSLHFCGQIRAWEQITLPALTLPTDTLAVTELSLWEGERRVAALPPAIYYYPAHVSSYTVTIMTPWATATCGRIQATNLSDWSSGIIMTDSACG